MKNSVHGDNKEMVFARREFLTSGAYAPLADAVSSLALKYGSALSPSPLILDIGCGEGYYTEAVLDKFLKEGSVAKICAFDISKDAVKLAAKRLKTGEFCVASAYHIPAPNESFDVALNMFSPLASDEVFRVLSNEGVFIMAIPNKDHLFELKAAIYDNPYKNEVADFALSGFDLIEVSEVCYTMKLSDRAQITSLFKMTPYAYRTKKSDADKLLSIDKLDVTASFLVIVYKKAKNDLTKQRASV